MYICLKYTQFLKIINVGNSLSEIKYMEIHMVVDFFCSTTIWKLML